MTIYYPPGTGVGPTASGTSVWAQGGVESQSRIALADIPTGTGVLWLSYFYAPVTSTISKLGASVGGTAAAGLTLARLALFTTVADDSITMVARTASTTSGWGSTFGDVSIAMNTTGGFPANYTVRAGVRYALGVLQVGSQAASLRGNDCGSNSAAAPVISRQVTGQADIATSYAVGTLSTWFNAIYLDGAA